MNADLERPFLTLKVAPSGPQVALQQKSVMPI